jgi:hypothetical protein
MNRPAESMSREEIQRLVAESGSVVIEALFGMIYDVGMRHLVLQWALITRGVVSAEDLDGARAELEALWAIESAVNPEIRAMLDQLQHLKDHGSNDRHDDDPTETP